MKHFLLLLGFVLSLESFAAENVVDRMVVSAEDVLTNKAPLTCKVFRQKDGSIAFVVGVNPSSERTAHFEGFDLRVMKIPLAASEIKERLRHAELWAWHRPNSNSTFTFVLTEEEIPKSYIVGRWSLVQRSSDILQMKEVCFSIGALVMRQPEGPTRR